MKGILEGIRIIDWTAAQVGPFAAAMLADLGAEVIHVEERNKGDFLRGTQTVYGLPLHLPSGRHISFEEHNRNKKSIAIDLSTPEGKKVIYRLTERSDVFLTNFRMKAIKKLEMDYETLSKFNPRLIYTLGSGFGLKGPDADSPSLDITGCARSGIMMSCGEPDAPVMMAMGIGDRTASFLLAYGTVCALYAREKQGIGQLVHVSQLGGLISLHGFTVMPHLYHNVPFTRHKHDKPPRSLYNSYRCKDNKWIVIAATGATITSTWDKLCEALAKPELTVDPRFSDEEGRHEHSHELTIVLEAIFATKSSEEWKALFKEHDILFCKVNDLPDLVSDPQVLANEYIYEWDHPELGPFKIVGFPVEFSKTPATIREPAPHFGQHTEEVLLEIGYSWEEITQLKDRNAI